MKSSEHTNPHIGAFFRHHVLWLLLYTPNNVWTDIHDPSFDCYKYGTTILLMYCYLEWVPPWTTIGTLYEDTGFSEYFQSLWHITLYNRCHIQRPHDLLIDHVGKPIDDVVRKINHLRVTTLSPAFFFEVDHHTWHRKMVYCIGVDIKKGCFIDQRNQLNWVNSHMY